MSPQQIQLMKLIQLPTQAFEQRLKQELEENPALDTGKEEKVDCKLKDNYSFVDIELDSLQSGIYKINGILRFYNRKQKFDIPFEKEFKVE